MVHRWANGGRGRAVLSFGDGEEGTQWGPLKFGSAEFIIFFSLFLLLPSDITHTRVALNEDGGCFVFIDFSHMIMG